MDGCDFYDYFVRPLQEMPGIDTGKLADNTLPDAWWVTNGGRAETIKRVAQAIHDEYFNTGAADHWGPAKFFAWYVDNVLNLAKIPNMDVVH